MPDITVLFIYWQPWQVIYINTYKNKKIGVKRGNIYIEGFDLEIALPALPIMETMNDQTHQTRQESEMSEAHHRETARAIEVILSRLKFDPETTRILKIHLTTQRSYFTDGKETDQ